VWDNVAFGLTIRRRPRAEIRERVSELLHLVQLEGFADRYPAQLSGGQRQRMALARALAVEPRVLLLDEPFGALDARVRQELRSWLRRLHQEVQVTTVLVTHDQEEAMEVAEEVVLMNHGVIEQIGSPTQVYDHPASEFVMTFIGHVNRVGDGFVRPHDVVLTRDAASDSEGAVIHRLVHLGYVVRAELELSDGRSVQAQMTRGEADRLDLEEGQSVYVSMPRVAVFSGTVK
jgi:sulfate transport system ATP-binding protein